MVVVDTGCRQDRQFGRWTAGWSDSRLGDENCL